jgi:hypothetical protein
MTFGYLLTLLGHMCGIINSGSCIRWVLGFGIKTVYDSHHQWWSCHPRKEGEESYNEVIREWRESDHEHWWKISSCDHRDKTLKPSMRSLLKAIKGATKMTNHTLRHKILRWWTHVNTRSSPLRNAFFRIKLRDGQLPNRSHDKKSVNSGHMSNRSKRLIIITTLLPLKTTSNKTSLIVLKRTIRASLNLIDPLASDRTNTWETGHKISCASLLKSSNLLSYPVLSFRMKNSIMIRSWLRKSSVCKNQRRVTVRWPTKVMTTSNKLP